ncbi:MAG: hypothetical protein K2M48_04235 [Clostridiales bacterium]|nr:hypothetical protein [Clostridiales bacterium]
MAQSIEQRLLQAIKNDDVKAFDALAETAWIGEFRLGRFPVPSLLYLYKARKILSAHERGLLGISEYIKKNEPAEISGKFAKAAGKTLRLYTTDKIVSPLEMLLILDKTKRLKRVYKDAAKTEEIKSRLQSIYAIKYALNVRFEGEDIIIDKRPLSYREKKKIITAGLCAALGVAVVVCVPTITVALMPTPIEGEVTKLGDIDFSSQKQYVLTRDIVLREQIQEVNCKISGKGGKLIFAGDAAFGSLNGSLTDLTIESSGNAVIDTVSRTAKISNVTVNVKADVASGDNAALFAVVNYGEFDGVTVNVRGGVAATEPNDENASELTIGGMVLNNSYLFNVQTQEVDFGIIKNCTVNYSQFELVGGQKANASFGGIAGVNNSYLQDCTVTGKIVSDTFDVAGVCTVNYGVLSGNVNKADISQVSADEGWNPIACGIVVTNAYTVENCENAGHISAVSTCETPSGEDGERTAAAAGIAYLNRSSNNTTVPYIVGCANSGAVESSASYGGAYAAGVCASSSGGIETCKNSGMVKAEAGGGFGAYVGGIAAYTYGYIYKSQNVGDVAALGSGEAYAGGISSYTRAQISYSTSSGNIQATAKNICAGGIFGFGDIDNYGHGTSEHCISENALDVTTVAGGAAYVGGIAGYIRELAGGGNAYFGGGVTDSCFIGSNKKAVSHFGNIVGAIGANIYETNLYYYNNEERHNLDGNYYAANEYTAIGATIPQSGELNTSVADKGANAASVETIKNTVTYKTIMEELEK